jgi:hypothetical protein
VSRRAATVILALALLLLLAGGAAWWLGLFRGGSRGGGAVAGVEGRKPITLPVDLYFPADLTDGGLLRVERRSLATSEAPRDQVHAIVAELLAGPKGEGLTRPLPEGVEVGSVLLAPEGIAFVNLQWKDHEDPPAGGSTAEMQMVYSLVNSITLNVPRVTRVALLWNGTQRLTFSGHLDTSLPLAPDRDLVAR